MSPIGIIDSGYNMDSDYVYTKFITGDIVLINCDEVEKTYADNIVFCKTEMQKGGCGRIPGPPVTAGQGGSALVQL